MICQSIDQYLKLSLAQTDKEIAQAQLDQVDASLPAELQTEATQRVTELQAIRTAILAVYAAA